MKKYGTPVLMANNGIGLRRVTAIRLDLFFLIL
jgi:hypothetical protein